MACTFACHVENLDAAQQETSDEQAHLEAIKIAANAFLDAAQIDAERTIAEAKLKADAAILASQEALEASEKAIKDSENYGLGAAKVLAPIAGAGLVIFAALKLYSILNNL